MSKNVVIPILGGIDCVYDPEIWPVQWDTEVEDASVRCRFELRKSKMTGRFLVIVEYSSPSISIKQGEVVIEKSGIAEALKQLLWYLEFELYGPSNLSQNNVVIARAHSYALRGLSVQCV